ncbi:adhesion G protein-coupled receptor F4 isoform X2 [Neoarius graeffei]|uniref:adhesion G protein-coupled receptor F4 isoform X2 n=1 Tax=Neoarius graeffei TaxID=443677 RepID=UPI00298D408F|nr:adhesion G protein-coupled receptor F4 isoform X2 [Neoarius graeffei]
MLSGSYNNIMSPLLVKTSGLLVDAGFIKIEVPDQVGYHDSANIKCTSPKQLDYVKWYIKRDAQSQQRVTNGTEANVSQDLQSSTVQVKKTSEVWKGTFICEYTATPSSNIIHTASAYLDVALLPQIIITSDPQFPDCRSPREFNVKIMCIIDNSTETYNVTWLPGNSQLKKPSSGESTITYTHEISIDCSLTKREYEATCTFKNRVENTINATVVIPVIFGDSVVCEKNDIWPEAVANYSARLQCNSNEVGFQSRECTGSTKGVWGTVIYQCVSADIWELLNEAENLERGHGLVEDNVHHILDLLKKKSELQEINTAPNINASVNVFSTLHNASETQEATFNKSIITDFMKSSSNLLNDSLLSNWKSSVKEDNYSLAVKYLESFEGIVTRIKTNSMDKRHNEENVQLIICNTSVEACDHGFNVTFSNKKEEIVYQAKIKNLPRLLPNFQDSDPSEFILSVTAKSAGEILMMFPVQRVPNHKIFCVYFNFTNSTWSDEGCEWGGPHNPNLCKCDHLSSFTFLMARTAVKLKYMDELTHTGLGFSICSLVLCLVIEFVVWNTVVKSNISHFKHTVLVNLSLCLLTAHCSFLAASFPNPAISQWCLAFTVMKHFCFLAVFFWMLCMSIGLLHQVIFVFVQLRKKVYLGLCFSLGYVCPLLIVICTIITYDNGAVDSYYVNETCWLKYDRALHGSIHAFVIPVGVIIFVNMFTMAVVISRLLKPNLSEGISHDQKETVRNVIRTIVLLTPTLGTTWIFGFFVLMVDLTDDPLAQIVNYAFTFLNSFQGFFILLTGCFGEKKVRDALLKRIRPQHSPHYPSKSSMSMTAAVKTK